MEKHIRLLDCTLRDGGHINQGEFGELAIRNIIERLVESEIDIIEVGFLFDQAYGLDTARYYSISDVKRILPKSCGKSKISLMADFIDLAHLEPYDGTVEYIRLSFKRHRLDWGLETARILMDKGYKVFINPVNNNVYSDQEYIEVLDKVNELHPYGFSIVDTFGVMRTSDLSHRYFLVENNLAKDITIGVHLHENLGLAFSLAQHIIEIANPQRNIIIDGSLLGMGRVPGNLCIEQIIDYVNERFGAGYGVEPIYDAIDDYIAPIKAKSPWGYAIPYALSAKYNLHRTYAEFLIGKKRLKTKDILRILSQIPQSEAETFNETYIAQLYFDYMNVIYQDMDELQDLREKISKYSKVLILSPGQSIMEAKYRIADFIDKDTCVIAVNFVPVSIGIKPDYIFLTNSKREDAVKSYKGTSKLIITSNLVRDNLMPDYTVAYNELVHFRNEYCNDSTIMLMKLLGKLGVHKIFFAGFDGRRDGGLLFFDDIFDRHDTDVRSEKKVCEILSNDFSDFDTFFLTDSIYKDI